MAWGVKEFLKTENKRNENMKKIIIAVLGIITGISAYGFTTCMRNGSYLGIFQKNVDGTAATVVSASDKTWQTTYGYTIYGNRNYLTGFASCNEINGTTTGHVQTNLVTGASDVGRYCWCQMYPIELNHGGPSSYWVFLSDYGTGNENDCNSGCTLACANAMRDNDDFRIAVFESMW